VLALFAARSNHKKTRVETMKAFITVMGHDTVGVVAKVSGLCSELNINIEDVTQSILQGMFAMIMLVDLSHCNVGHEELHRRTDALAAEMKMQINVTRQEVFDAMHTI
jgi:ACT domain-containing protein